jgi:hypothetical protein
MGADFELEQDTPLMLTYRTLEVSVLEKLTTRPSNLSRFSGTSGTEHHFPRLRGLATADSAGRHFLRRSGAEAEAGTHRRRLHGDLCGCREVAFGVLGFELGRIRIAGGGD